PRARRAVHVGDGSGARRRRPGCERLFGDRALAPTRMVVMSTFPPRLAPLLEESSPVQQLARLLADAGHESYLVGGSVRDAFLDRAPRAGDAADLDVTTDARPDVVEAIVRPWADAVWLQGQRFGTVGCRKDDAILEITTFRAEVYRPESRKPTVVFSDD